MDGSIPYSKLVVSGTADGDDLNNNQAVWRTQFTEAKNSFGWNGGGMIWQCHPTALNGDPTWVKTISG